MVDSKKKKKVSQPVSFCSSLKPLKGGGEERWWGGGAVTSSKIAK